MEELIRVFTKKEQLKRFIMIVFICSIIFIPYKYVIRTVLLQGNIEPLNPLCPAIGIYLGPIGALGVSVANLILDIYVFNEGIVLSLVRFFALFIYSYIPYKTWYTIGKNSECDTPNLDDASAICKYFYILFMDSVIVILMLQMSYELIGVENMKLLDLFILIFNTINVPILIGIITMILLSIFKTKRYIPQSNKSKKNTNNYVFILLILLLLGAGSLFYYEYIDGFHNKITLVFFIVVMLILLFLYIQLPITKKINNINKNKITMKGKVALVFLSIGVILICFQVSLFYLVLEYLNNEPRIILRTIYIVIGVCTYFIFAVILIILIYMESRITNPLATLSSAVKDFSKLENYCDFDKNNRVKELCKSIRCNNEIEELSIEFSNMVSRIEGYCENVSVMAKEREREEIEMALATKIQESILPRHFPAFPDRTDFGIFANMTPAKGLGGDFYDFFLIGEDKLCFLVADVSGKGAPAALIMMSAKTIIKNHLLLNCNIVEAVREVNKQLSENNDACMFVTSFVSVVDLKTGLMSYISAGHNPPLIRSNDKEFKYLKVENNLVLGIDPSTEFIKQEIMLKKGDIIFVYTDGVTEALDKNGKLFGVNKLIETLNAKKYQNIYHLIPYVRGKIDEFCAETPQTDDITMLIFKYH